MFPNFQEIAKIDNEFQRIALYTSTGTLRETLEKAFPECYSEDSNNLHVPASLLRKMSAEIASADFLPVEDEGVKHSIRRSSELHWGRALVKLGVPIAFSWDKGDSVEMDPTPIPGEVWRQLAGQHARGGIEVEYMGERFLLINILSSVEIGELLGDFDDLNMDFVLSSFIDLNS